MKVLAIKQPWAALIAENKKPLEVRSGSTNTRERIAIYASRSVWNPTDFTEIYKFLDSSAFVTGAIIATAELYDCFKFDDCIWDFESWNDKHHVLDAFPSFDSSGKYGWCLSDIKKLEQPISYKMPKGCVVWANYEGKL